MNRHIIEVITRHSMTALGGVLVSSGVIDPSTSEILVGSMVGISGVIWSFIEKKQRKGN